MLSKSFKRENFDNILANELDFSIFMPQIWSLTHIYLSSFDAIYSRYRTGTILPRGEGEVMIKGDEKIKARAFLAKFKQDKSLF